MISDISSIGTLFFAETFQKSSMSDLCNEQNLELAALYFKLWHHEAVAILWRECNYIEIYEKINLQIGSWNNPPIVHSRFSFDFVLFIISFREDHDELYALIPI